MKKTKQKGRENVLAFRGAFFKSKEAGALKHKRGTLFSLTPEASEVWHLVISESLKKRSAR